MSKLKYILSVFIYISYMITAGEFAEEEKKVGGRGLEKSQCTDKEEFSETQHEVIVNGKLLNYKAIAGSLILKDEKCQPKANLFFISYTKDGTENQQERPITFCFNGGPGSSSVWLHLGILGPKRVSLTENGDALPPYHLVDNEFSLLDTTDLVFIDPVSTGYSRAIPPDEAKHYHGVEEDIKSVAEFIRLYLTRYNRWESPKFLIGESYGTTRAAGLAGYLHDNDFIYINGIMLISAVLNFQSIEFDSGNDLPYLMYLPSYAATAWYHKKLNAELQADLLNTLKIVREFVVNDYSVGLFKGDLLTPSERERLVDQLAQLTGLSKEYVDQSNLRIEILRFVKELLRGERRTVGRFDSRFKGIDADVVGEHFEYDPSGDAVFGAFTAAFNHYVHTDLKWTKDSNYKILVNVQPWDYGSSNQYLNVGGTLGVS